MLKPEVLDEITALEAIYADSLDSITSVDL